MATNEYFEDAKKFQWQGRYNEAIQYYNAALGIEPGNGEIYWEMALSLAHLGRWEDVEKVREKAAQLDPRFRAKLESIKKFKAAKTVLDTLSQSSDVNDIDRFLPFLEDPDRDIRDYAKDKFKQSAFQADALPALHKLLDGDVKEIKLAVIEKLGELAHNDSVDLLLKRMDDDDDDIRYCAEKALGKFTNDKVKQSIQAIKDARKKT